MYKLHWARQRRGQYNFINGLNIFPHHPCKRCIMSLSHWMTFKFIFRQRSNPDSHTCCVHNMSFIGGSDIKKIVAASRGMHVSPAKHSFGKCDRKVWQTDRQTDAGQSDPYVSLCFAGDTINIRSVGAWNKNMSLTLKKTSSKLISGEKAVRSCYQK